MTEQEIKELIESKKDSILKCMSSRLSLNTYNNKSSVWVYNMFADEVEYVTDIGSIKSALLFKPYIHCLIDKEDADMYKWLFNFIQDQITESSLKNLSGPGWFSNDS